MILGAAGTEEASEALGWFQLGLVAVGMLLLCSWLWARIRGRDLVPRAPAPEIGFRVWEAVLALVLWMAIQVTAISTAVQLGMEQGTDLNLVVKLAEAGAVALILGAWIARNPSHGPRGRGALTGLAVCVGSLPVVWAILLATKAIWESAGREWADQEIRTGLQVSEPWKYVVLAAVLAPLIEEVIFRGVIHGALRKVGGRQVAAVGSAALFAVVHPEMSVWPAIFVLGLLLSWTYERTGTLFGPVAFHGLFNSITVVGDVALGGG